MPAFLYQDEGQPLQPGKSRNLRQTFKRPPRQKPLPPAEKRQALMSARRNTSVRRTV